jgi:hypothetical protein
MVATRSSNAADTTTPFLINAAEALRLMFIAK